MNSRTQTNIEKLLWQIRNILVVLLSSLVESDEPEKFVNEVIHFGMRKRSKGKKKSKPDEDAEAMP